MSYPPEKAVQNVYEEVLERSIVYPIHSENEFEEIRLCDGICFTKQETRGEAMSDKMNWIFKFQPTQLAGG